MGHAQALHEAEYVARENPLSRKSALAESVLTRVTASDFKNHSSSLYLRLRNETLKEIVSSEQVYITSLSAVVKVCHFQMRNLSER